MSRMSLSEFARLPRAAEALGQASPAAPKVARRHRRNKWEQSFEDEILEPWRKKGRIDAYRFEALTLTLYDGSSDVRMSRFTPDFVAWIPTTQLPDPPHRIRIFEVKGQRRRETIEKLKNAAQHYPCFEFYLCTGGPGRWQIDRL